MNSSFAAQLDQQGFFIYKNFFAGDEVSVFEKALNDINAFDYSLGNDQGNLLKVCSDIAQLAASDRLNAVIPGFNKMIAVKAFILDKSKEFNWTIPWHQDLKIAVKNKAETEGYDNWTTEAGILHVEPPLSVLEGMVTVRVHLDNCDRHNGAMQVITGSHTLGRLNQSKIDHLIINRPEIWCEAKRGDIMVFKPLILHYSPLSEVRQSRRILQLEYAPESCLARGLQWHI